MLFYLGVNKKTIMLFGLVVTILTNMFFELVVNSQNNKLFDLVVSNQTIMFFGLNFISLYKYTIAKITSTKMNSYMYKFYAKGIQKKVY